MKLVFRKLKRDETDWELAAGLLFVPLVGVGLFVARLFPGRLVPSCRLRDWVGIPCPTCGTYRCACFLAHGQILEAFIVQPLATLLVGGVLLYSLYAWVVVCLRCPRLRLEPALSRAQLRRIGWAVLGLFLADWVYLILAL